MKWQTKRNKQVNPIGERNGRLRQFKATMGNEVADKEKQQVKPMGERNGNWRQFDRLQW